jgi:hypothetical protein
MYLFNLGYQDFTIARDFPNFRFHNFNKDQLFIPFVVNIALWIEKLGVLYQQTICVLSILRQKHAFKAFCVAFILKHQLILLKF